MFTPGAVTSGFRMSATGPGPRAENVAIALPVVRCQQEALVEHGCDVDALVESRQESGWHRPARSSVPGISDSPVSPLMTIGIAGDVVDELPQSAPASAAFLTISSKRQPVRCRSAMLPLTSSPLIRAWQPSAAVPVSPVVERGIRRHRRQRDLPSTGSTSCSSGVKLRFLHGVLAREPGRRSNLHGLRHWTRRRAWMAAAVMTRGPPAGEPMVPRFGPSLPAATTAKTPALAAASSARSSGAVVRVEGAADRVANNVDAVGNSRIDGVGKVGRIAAGARDAPGRSQQAL